MQDFQGRLWWALRIGAAACFIGHGAFGVIGKDAWLPFFAQVGIGPDIAWRLMPIVGTIDILAGIAVLVRPRPIVFAYMLAWAMWTALLRPLSGDRFAEFLERAGNYGIPLMLLVVSQWPRTVREWLAPAIPRTLDAQALTRVASVAMLTTATLLAGHAWLGIVDKPLLGTHYASIGWGAGATQAVGWFEFALAGVFLAAPTAIAAAFIFGWKVATESLFLVAGSPIWEFVERGGSYAAPLVVLMIGRQVRLPDLIAPRLRRAGATATLLMLVSTGVASGQQAAPSDAEIVDLLRRGGVALACRHAITDHSRGDREPVDYSDRSTQRVLSTAGEAQARALGVSIKTLGLSIGEVYANPFFRTRESATYAFGKAEVMDSLGKSGVLRRQLLREVPASAVRVFMTRAGMLSSAFRGMRAGEFAEGDCAIVQRRESSYSIVARLTPADFERLARK